MKTRADSERDNLSTEGNEVNEEWNRRTRGAPGEGRGSFWSALRLLLLNFVRPAVLFAAVALLPTFAQGEAVESLSGRGEMLLALRENVAGNRCKRPQLIALDRWNDINQANQQMG